MENLLNNNNLNLDVKRTVLSNDIGSLQATSLKTDFGKALNSALDNVLKFVLPDQIEDGVINIKNNLINYGIKDGLGKTVQDIINAGKSFLGISDNNLESIEQAESVIEKGGATDKISELLDSSINKLEKNNSIYQKTVEILKKEKNNIVNEFEKNINKSFSNQVYNKEKIDKYISNWNEYYKQQNFEKMEKEFNKMEKLIEELLPLEKTISNYRIIENLQNLIKNNGNNFDLTQEQLDLANKLIN